MNGKIMGNHFVRRVLTLSLTASLGLMLLAGCGSTKDAGTSAQAFTAAGESNASTGQVYRTLDEIKESGTINIGVFSDKNPFGFVDENGDYQGYDV